MMIQLNSLRFICIAYNFRDHHTVEKESSIAGVKLLSIMFNDSNKISIHICELVEVSTGGMKECD